MVSNKQILLISDIAGNSKVGMGAMIPVLSYMGFPTFNLPTALVSNTFDYGKFSILDTTQFIRETLQVWQELSFGYDAICTGCMFGEEQTRLVANYCREQSRKGTIIFVDPVMGDGGHLYNGMTTKQVDLMREMVAVADLAMPNYTEATLLTGKHFSSEGIFLGEAYDMLGILCGDMGCKSALITSCPIEGRNCVAGYNHYNNEYFALDYEEIPGLFHGTGDLFSAILVGHLLKGEPLKHCTRIAMDTVYHLLELNKDMKDLKRGILIEQFLGSLPQPSQREGAKG